MHLQTHIQTHTHAHTHTHTHTHTKINNLNTQQNKMLKMDLLYASMWIIRESLTLFLVINLINSNSELISL